VREPAGKGFAKSGMTMGMCRLVRGDMKFLDSSKSMSMMVESAVVICLETSIGMCLGLIGGGARCPTDCDDRLGQIPMNGRYPARGEGTEVIEDLPSSGDGGSKRENRALPGQGDACLRLGDRF
jgi:hypothetical protein